MSTRRRVLALAACACLIAIAGIAWCTWWQAMHRRAPSAETRRELTAMLRTAEAMTICRVKSSLRDYEEREAPSQSGATGATVAKTLRSDVVSAGVLLIVLSQAVPVPVERADVLRSSILAGLAGQRSDSLCIPDPGLLIRFTVHGDPGPRVIGTAWICLQCHLLGVEAAGHSYQMLLDADAFAAAKEVAALLPDPAADPAEASTSATTPAQTR